LGIIFDTTGKDDKEIEKRVTQARRTIIGCLNGVFWSTETGKNVGRRILEDNRGQPKKT